VFTTNDPYALSVIAAADSDGHLSPQQINRLAADHGMKPADMLRDWCSWHEPCDGLSPVEAFLVFLGY
jgi:hypothetical protein